jgi:hypothetical protein
MHWFDNAKDFEAIKDDGFTLLGKPMLLHQRMFKSFLLITSIRPYWKKKDPLKIR